MAGTDQSVNLTGMLSGIANTLSQGYEIGGVSAGEALGNNIRQAAKPELDMKDPVSIRKYADWAGRNGKDEEALLMQQKAVEVEDQLNLNKGLIEVGRVENTGLGNADAGELNLLGVQIDKMDQISEQALRDNNFALYEKAKEASQTLRQRVEPTKSKQHTNQVNHIDKVREALKTGMWTGSGENAVTKKLSADERKGLQAQLDQFERAKPDVIHDANKLKVDKAATNLQVQEAELQSIALPKVRQAVKGGKTVEQLIEADPSLAVHRSEMEAEYNLLLQQKLDGDALVEAVRAADKPYDDSFLSKRIADLPPELAGNLQEQLDRVGTKVTAGKVNQGDKGVVEKELARIMEAVATQEAQVRSNEYAMGEESRQQARTGAAQLEVDIDTGVISDSFLTLGKKAYEELYHDGEVLEEKGLTDEQVAGIRELAREEQVDAVRRLNIRAGMEGYVPLSEDLKAQAEASIREARKTMSLDDAKDEIDDIATALISDNHDPKLVADIVGKQLEEIQYLVDIIAEDDARAAAQAQEQFATSKPRTGQDHYNDWDAGVRERLTRLASANKASANLPASPVTYTGLPGSTNTTPLITPRGR